MATPSGHLPGQPMSYSTGDGAVGEDPQIIATDPAEFVSEVSAVRQNEPHPSRGRISGASGARLTISPSMKVPESSPAPTQGMGRVVPSQPGRSTGTFFMGMDEERSDPADPGGPPFPPGAWRPPTNG